MHLTGIGGARSIRDISAVVGTLATNATSDTGSAQTTPVRNTASNRADSAHFSSASQFLSNLQELKSSDPAKFTQVCQDIADTLEGAAEQRGGGRMAGLLSDLAAKFQALTEGGAVSELSPEQQAGATSGAPTSVQQYVQNDQPLLDGAAKGSPGHHLEGGNQRGPYGIGRLLPSIFELVDQAVAELPTVAPPPAETQPVEPPASDTPVDPPATDVPSEPPAVEAPVPTPTDAVPV
ncbi:MAG: hypothetical protein Q7T82_06100 [Armatimonadota bacterium]|nr:hypothetical protein [Armatimonadota bacterium]